MSDKKTVELKDVKLDEKSRFSKYKVNTKRSKLDNRVYKAEAIYPQAKKVSLPETLDYRPTLQPIRDQGDQGACAAFTAACMKEWQERKENNMNEYMSPQFIYNNRADLKEEGMESADVMKILHKKGSCRESLFKYNTHTAIPQSAIDEAKKYLISAYAQINTLETLKTALATNGPCYMAIPVYNYGVQMWKPASQSDQEIGGHAVVVVGYTKDSLILRNHWSEEWGDKGYFYFPFTDFGMQWELWTTIDANSYSPVPPTPVVPKNSECCVIS